MSTRKTNASAATKKLIVGAMSSAWPHQTETLKFSAKQPLIMDTSDPGTGKTFAHIVSYANDLLDGKAGRCLVVAPLTLLTAAWASDIERFTPHLSWSVASAGKRKAAFDASSDIVLINIDGINDVQEPWLKGFTHLIIDEFTAYKHGSARRTKKMMKLSKLKSITHKRLLSGTPNPKSVTELWAPMYILDGGKSLGTSFSAFRNAVQTSTQVGPSPGMRSWKDKPGITETVFHMIKQHVIRHEFEKVMTHVPANHKRYITFNLSPKALAAYKKLETEAILAFEDGSVASAVHAAALRTKLLQAASGAVYSSTGYSVVDKQRYSLVADLVETEGKCVVAFNWKHQRDELAKEFAARGISFGIIDGDVSVKERQSIIDAFQSGQLDVVLMHPKTGAHGITLTAGNATIFASPIYEADITKQFIARIYRGAQDKVTNTIFVEASGTVERIVYERNNANSVQMEDLLTSMSSRRGK